MVFLGLTIVSSLWIWKILLVKPFLALLMIIGTILLYRFSKDKPVKNLLVYFILAILIFFQYGYTEKASLINLSNDQIRVRDMRLNEYPPVHFSIGSKTLWLPVAHLFEGRKESIALGRIQNNFFQSLDPNQYFFAGHPKERVGISEFEKFPYILLPFFVIGLVEAVRKKKNQFLFLAFIVPLIFYSFVGHKSLFGEFLFFPFLVICITKGLKAVFKNIRRTKNKILRLFFFIILFTLVLVQTISYQGC